MSSIPFLKSAQPLASGVWLRRSLAWLLMLGMLMPAIAMAQLTQRFSTSDNGNIVQTGNTLTTCTGSGCAAAQSGGTSSNQNFTITQLGVPCAYELSIDGLTAEDIAGEGGELEAFHGEGSEIGTVDVSTGVGCPVVVDNSLSWVHILAGAGGSGRAGTGRRARPAGGG